MRPLDAKEIQGFEEVSQACEDVLDSPVFRRYRRTTVPSSESVHQVKKNTASIGLRLLYKVLAHTSFRSPYDAFSYLAIQVELLEHTLYCERMISQLRLDGKTRTTLYDELRERRLVVKFLGSTVAWILLGDDNKDYIQSVAYAEDQGYSFGKEGTIAEAVGLVEGYRAGNHSVLHAITGCLRAGDLTMFDGKSISTLEIKRRKNVRARASSRERRQLDRLVGLNEFLRGGSTQKLRFKGFPINRVLSTLDTESYYWQSISFAASEAKSRGWGIRFPARGIACAAIRRFSQTEHIYKAIERRNWGHDLMLGVMHREVDGDLPHVKPFTLFRLPLRLKKEILIRSMRVTMLFDVDWIVKAMNRRGVAVKVEGDSFRIRKVKWSSR